MACNVNLVPLKSVLTVRGTCAMKPRDQGGVVDKFLNVYGTENLKIAGQFTNDPR